MALFSVSLCSTLSRIMSTHLFIKSLSAFYRKTLVISLRAFVPSHTVGGNERKEALGYRRSYVVTCRFMRYMDNLCSGRAHRDGTVQPYAVYNMYTQQEWVVSYYCSLYCCTKDMDAAVCNLYTREFVALPYPEGRVSIILSVYSRRLLGGGQ